MLTFVSGVGTGTGLSETGETSFIGALALTLGQKRE
jgi:hypothetical protein